ncbi:MAG: M48 family metalloprotease, partial [Thermodesulfobacteriota bacterium]|nr:M48 family metalloprotease [Thermodesulfobacteriota bacterium]
FFLHLFACSSSHSYKRDESQEDGKFLTLEQEVGWGRAIDEEIRREYVLFKDVGLQKKISEIGNQIVNHSERKELKFKFQILYTNEVNAFAVPGGFIYITTGFLDRIENIDELACVLGHEIAHIALNHSVEQLQTIIWANRGINFLKLGTIIVGGPAIAFIATDFITFLGMKGYSRGYEKEADTNGTVYAFNAGYDPGQLINLFKKMEEEDKKYRKKVNVFENYLRTHPPFDKRIANIEKVIDKLMENKETN